MNESSSVADGRLNISSWIPVLSEITAGLGLQIITHEFVPVKDELNPLWLQSIMLGLEEYASKLDGAAAENTRELIKEMKEEIAQGTNLETQFFVMVARKVPGNV